MMTNERCESLEKIFNKLTEARNIIEDCYDDINLSQIYIDPDDDPLRYLWEAMTDIVKAKMVLVKELN